MVLWPSHGPWPIAATWPWLFNRRTAAALATSAHRSRIHATSRGHLAFRVRKDLLWRCSRAPRRELGALSQDQTMGAGSCGRDGASRSRMPALGALQDALGISPRLLPTACVTGVPA